MLGGLRGDQVPRRAAHQTLPQVGPAQRSLHAAQQHVAREGEEERCKSEESQSEGA